MERVGEHPVPAGPLAVRWLAREVPRARAGALYCVPIVLENAGAAPWRDLKLSYHWLDPLGNPVVWDGLRTELGRVEPGTHVEVEAAVRAPMPPGRYRLAFDLVLEYRYWLGEIGNAPLEEDVRVEPRIERRLAAVGGRADNQEEPLVALEEAEAVAHLAPAVEPPPEWSRLVLDAHQEGFAAVGGSIDAHRRALAPWAPGAGRVPAFPRPLLCPSFVVGIEPIWTEPVEGLPAAEVPADEPWVYDGRVTLALRR
jgi:hypothetical protein